MEESLAEISEEIQKTQRNKYLTFYLEKEVYGIEIKYVTEIVGIQKISSLPESPDYFKGIINLRRKIIPIIDMRIRLKKEPVPYTDRTCIVVINLSGTSVGLIVDRVKEVAKIDEQNIVPLPEMAAGHQSRYIKGIGKADEEIRLLLDCEQMFQDEELDSLSQIS